MRPVSYLPLCTALLLLFQFTPPHTHAAGLFSWGTQNGDIFAWDDEVSNSHKLIVLSRPFNFNGVMRPNISVSIYQPRCKKTGFVAYAKAKAQISFAVTAKPISDFVSATPIPLHPKFEISSL